MIQQQDKEIILNNLNLPLSELLKLFNDKYTKKQIKNFCNNNHLKYGYESAITISYNHSHAIKKQRHQTMINHDYFKTWSHNMSYILGLWYADGCIYTNKGRGYYFSIKQHERDEYLLQNILKEIESKHKIFHNKDKCCHITFSSKTIYTDIKNIGGIENKSLLLKVPKIPSKYMPDFLRGYFDGDGCVSYNRHGKYFSRYICSGNIDFLNEIYVYLKNNNIIQSSGVYYSPSMNVPRLQFNKNDGISFEKYIMSTNSTLYLKRKHFKEKN